MLLVLLLRLPMQVSACGELQRSRGGCEDAVSESE